MGTGGLRLIWSNPTETTTSQDTVDYGLIMIEAKELRVFVYLLVFFPAIGFDNERPQLNLQGARKTTPFPVVPHPSTERAAQTA